MKKIIYILVALGLVLGLTVVATPAAANVSNVTAVGDMNVACACTNWTITFTTSLALSTGQKVYLRFPAGSALNSSCGSTAVKLEWYNPVTMLWETKTPSATGTFVYGDGTTQLHITIGSGTDELPAGNVRLSVGYVANPTKAGTYTIKVSTEREPTEVASNSFTVIAGPTVSPSSLVWCAGSCHGVEFTVNWGSACGNCVKNITTSNGTQVGNWSTYNILGGATNVTIDCGNLTALNLLLCAPEYLIVEFCLGCNVTIPLTVANWTTITLNPGWNLISLPIIPLSTDIEDVLAGLGANVTKVISVWYWDCGSWYVYKNGSGFDSLETMDACGAYWVCMNTTGPAVMGICGFEFPCPPAVPPKCCYHECWNMVGYKSTNATMELWQYTASLPAGVLQGCLTFNGGWIVVTNTTQMTPGLGYWMAFADDACIVPPIS